MRQRHHRVKLERGNELGQHFRRLTSIKITDFRLIPVTGVGNRQDSDNTRTNYKKTGRTDRPGQDKREQNPNCRAVNANGAKFWSVYVVKPASKNAKEVRVDAASGKILNVQTEKPEDQAEEPAKTH